MMEDRYLMMEGKPQIYGTQGMSYEDERGSFIWPIENPETVNQRRKEAGFEETIEDYAKVLFGDDYVYQPRTMEQINKKVASYILQKLGYALLTLFGVVTVIFLLFTILPGDPARMMLGQNETAEQLAVVKKKYGFDQPVSVQYVRYLNDLSPISFHSKNQDDYTFLSEGKYNAAKLFSVGNTNVVLKTPYLRESFQKNGKEVSEVIAETLPNTFILAVSAIIIAMIIGVFLGIISVLFKDGL